MLDNLNMSLLLSILMLFTNAFTIQPNTEYYVTASSCYLYEDASFTAEKVKDGENYIILTHGDVVISENEEGNFALITIKNTEIQGYIYKYYISQNSSQSVYPVFNARVREDSIIYDLNKQETHFSAKKDQRVYIYEGFNDKEEYTAVQVVLEDGSLYNGFILTKNIQPDGISNLLIVAISIISAIVTIVLAVVFLKKFKNKKK